jgi:hypothetical protein
MKYKIWVMRQSRSAKNKAMIGIAPSQREQEHLDTFKWNLFEFELGDHLAKWNADQIAQTKIIELINQWIVGDPRPIAGLSYIPKCR